MNSDLIPNLYITLKKIGFMNTQTIYHFPGVKYLTRPFR